MPLPLYLLALAIFAMGTSEFMLGGLTPDIADSVGVSVGSAGLLTSAFAIGMVLGAPLMAVLSRQWNRRASLLTFVALFAAAHVVGALSDRFDILLVARVVAAFANAGFLAVALNTVGTLVGPDRTGRALGVLLSGTTLATIVGVPAGALLGGMLGWRATFWAIAALCVPAAVGVAVGISKAGLSTSTRPDVREELRQLCRPRLQLMMVLGAVVNGSTFATFTFLAPIVTHQAGLSEPWVPATLMLFGLGAFVGVTIAARLSDTRPWIAVMVGAPLLLLGWCALGVAAHHAGLLLPMVFVQGLLGFGVGSTLIARILREASTAQTLGGSYATVALNVGAAAGPALAGVAIESPMGELGPVGISSALTALAIVLAVCGRHIIALDRPIA